MIRAYKYGCLPPTKNADLVEQQIARAHRYANALIEVERARRVEVRALPPELSKDDPARVKINDRYHGRKLDERRRCGLYWGTYQLVEDSHEQIVSSTPLDVDPAYRKWTGAGRIGVQFIKGLLVSAATGTGTQLQLDPVPEGTYTGTRGERRRGSRTVMRIRAGSEGTRRTPIFVPFPIVMHRPLPASGVIKKVIVSRYRVGTIWKYEADFLVADAAVAAVHDDDPRAPIVGIDLGWRRIAAERKLPVGIREGFWHDGAVGIGEYKLPSSLADKAAHAQSIDGIRKRRFNEFRVVLAEWIGGQPDLPEWFRLSARTIRAWKSPDRLWHFVCRWRRERFDADAEIWDRVEEWWTKDRHLHEWTDNEAAKVLGHRNDLYGVWAAKIARSYQAVVMEKFDLRRIAGTASDEDKDDEDKAISRAARAIRHLTAPSVFRLAIRRACARYGAKYVEVPAQYTTLACHACGVIDDTWDPIRELSHACSGCGLVWDQDENAARNLVARGRAALLARAEKGDHGVNGEAAKKSRYERRQEAKRSREARKSGRSSSEIDLRS